jgi:glycosyltransferase involved in cell wall biosynthesis
MKTILIVSDVLISEQVNGVGTWLINTKKGLEQNGFNVVIFNASLFSLTFPLPSYPEIRLVLSSPRKVRKLLEEINPDYIHVATEGTLGLLSRKVCIDKKWNFTTSYHTRFPEYVFVRTKMMFLQNITYAYMRWFHNKASRTVVTTKTLKEELVSRQFNNITVVPLGVDIELFTRNIHSTVLPKLQKPIFVYFGRVAPEKNVEAFLQCKWSGSKLVIGDGPSRKDLEKKYSENAHFVGYKRGQELIDLLSVSDVCVFTSKTDTFGLTIIEALACSLPVVAYDVQGPNNIITNEKDGYLGENLEENAVKCLSLTRENCRQTAETYSWEHATKKFVDILTPR